METIYKTFRAELKEADEDGSLNIFIPVSTASMDRDSEIIEPSAFKKTIPKFMNHPVLVASHDYRDLTNQIGEWTKLKITENGIEGKPKYYVGMGNEQADWAFKLAQKGVAAFSIGFIPTKWEDGDGVKTARRTYQELELLEISQVIIPSNRDAIMGMRSKGVDPIVDKALDDVLSDKELIPIAKKLVSQSEIIDEIDYLKEMMAEGGMNDDVVKSLKELIPSMPKEVMKMDMGKMQEMHDMMQSCEGMAKKAKKMSEDMMNKEDMDEEDMKERLPGNDIPVKDKLTNTDILESLKRIGGK